MRMCWANKVLNVVIVALGCVAIAVGIAKSRVAGAMPGDAAADIRAVLERYQEVAASAPFLQIVREYESFGVVELRKEVELLHSYLHVIGGELGAALVASGECALLNAERSDGKPIHDLSPSFAGNVFVDGKSLVEYVTEREGVTTHWAVPVLYSRYPEYWETRIRLDIAKVLATWKVHASDHQRTF